MASAASGTKRARAAARPAVPTRDQEEGYEIDYTPHYEVLVKEGQ